MNPVIRVMRVMQIAFIVSVLLFYSISRMIQPAGQSLDDFMQWVIVLCAAASAAGGFSVQRMFLRVRSQALATTRKSTPLSRWKVGHLMRFASAESVALYGVVMRTTGGSSTLSAALFAGSLLLLALWQPGAVPNESESQGPIR